MASTQNILYELVQTTAGAKRAMAQMAMSPFMMLDLEGHRLGCVGGALSLICVGTRNAGIFLFDAVTLEPNVLLQVLCFISDPHKVKFMWDARKDFSELYHGHGIGINNIIDLQLVDILERERAKYKAGGRVWTLDEERAKPLVHTLLSLKSVAQVYDIPALYSLPMEWPRQRHEDWMMRPLPAAMLEYAARDITILSHTHQHFLSQGFLNERYTLTIQSIRYSTLHARMRPESEDPFQGSSLLPLEILYEPPPIARRLECVACRRMLTQPSFNVEDCENGFVCRVCSLLRRRQKSAWIGAWERVIRRTHPFYNGRDSFKHFDTTLPLETSGLRNKDEPASKNSSVPDHSTLPERSAAYKFKCS